MFRRVGHQPASRPKREETPAAVTITDTAPCQKSLRLRVGREAVAPVRAAVLAEFQREAALPGFRKGKAPAELIERQHAKAIQEEALRRLTRQALEQAAKDHNLKPVGPFELKAAQFSETDGLTLEATVEVEPSFTLGSYKGIRLKREPVEVTPQEIDKALAALQESMAQLVPAGEGQPKERRLPAIDNELAKDLGFESLEKLKAHVEATLREQKRKAQAQRLESALCDELLARHAFEVPSGLVSRQTERLTRDFKVRLLLSGVPEEQLEAEVTKFTQELRTSAERNVKLTVLLDRIATQESITVTQDELVERLWQLSQRWKKDPADVRKIFDAQGLWPSVASAIRQEHTTAFLLSAAAIEDGAAANPTHQPLTREGNA